MPVTTYATRASGAAGVAGVVLLLAGLSALGDAPDPHIAAQPLAAYFVHHHTDVFISTALVTVGALGLIAFLAALRERMSEAGAPILGTIAFTAGAGVVALLELNHLIYATLAHQVGADSPTTAKALFSLTTMSPTLQGPLCVALLVATSVAGLRRPMLLRRWLAVAGLIAAVVVLPATVSFADSGFFYPDVQQQVFGQIFLLWMLAAAIATLRRRTTNVVDVGSVHAATISSKTP